MPKKRPFATTVLLIKRRCKKARIPSSLVQRHAIGTLLNEMEKERGQDDLAAMSKALAAAGLVGVGVSNLRKLAKFGRLNNPPEAAAFDQAGLSWRDADRIRSKHLTSTLGRSLPNSVIGLNVMPGGVGKFITKASSPEARETLRTVTTAGTRAGKAIQLLGKIVQRAGADDDIRDEARRVLETLDLQIKAIAENRPPPRPPIGRSPSSLPK